MKRRLILWLAALLDRLKFSEWSSTPNGSERLQAMYQSMDDMKDSLEAIAAAVRDGDGDEALRLIQLADESITDHIDTLKELL